MLPLQAVTPEVLVHHFPQLWPKEARKVVATVHRDEPLRGAQGLRRQSLEALEAGAHVPQLALEHEAASALDPFCKYVFKTLDGHWVETVRIPLEKDGRFSVCVSSQVGCAMACAFCATGRLGLTRNLAAWEIVEQARVVRRSLLGRAGARVHGVVFQGMGEPMANLDSVLTAIAVMTNPCALAIDARCITVCTSGHPAGILRLAAEAPKVRLGLSVGSARPEVRRAIMPLEPVHPLANVLDAAVQHVEVTGLAPMWAVTLLRGVNDTQEDALALAALAKDFQARSGKWPGVTVVPYNRISADETDPFRRSLDEVEHSFREVLRAHGVFTKKRYSGGHDVAAACGQLAARAEQTPRGRGLPASDLGLPGDQIS